MDQSLVCPFCPARLHGRACFSSITEHVNISHPGQRIVFLCSRCQHYKSEKGISVRAHSAKCSGPKPVETAKDLGNPLSIPLTQEEAIRNTAEELVELVELEELVDPFTTPPALEDTTDPTFLTPAADPLNTPYEDLDSSRVTSSACRASVAAIAETLNSLSDKPNLHLRHRYMLRQMLTATSEANPDDIKELLNTLTDIYTNYLTAVDRARLPASSERLTAMGLHCISLPTSAQLILRTVSFLVYRNPTRQREVAANILCELRSDPARWSAHIRDTEHTSLNYDETIRQMERGVFTSPILTLQIAADVYQRIFRVIAVSVEQDIIIAPTHFHNKSLAVSFCSITRDGSIRPCIPRSGYSSKQQRQLQKRRNRALYYSNTSKLAKELLRDEAIPNRFPLDKHTVFAHYKQLLSRTSTTAAHVDQTQQDNDTHVIPIIESSAISNALKRTNRTTAAGPDGVTVNQVLRFDPGQHVLTLLCNIALQTGCVPESWKGNRTILIPKKGKVNASDPSDPRNKDVQNYRPITVSSLLSRAFHKVLLSLLREHVPCPTQQFAFSRDATTTCIKAVRAIRNYAMSKKRRHYFAFLDIKAAFDTLEHAALYNRLTQLGCPAYLRRYIASLYRESYTRIHLGKGETTDEIPIHRGVKQGDPLSSFLFALCLDQCLEGLSDKSVGFATEKGVLTNMAYADDVVLMTETPAQMQAAIDHVQQELKRMGMSLSATKCTTMGCDFVGGKPQHRATPFVHVDGAQLPCAHEDEDPIKYLGSTPFTPIRLQDVIDRLDSTMLILRSSQLSPTQIVHLMNDYYLPSMLYRCSVSPLSATALREIDRKWRTLAKATLRLPHYITNGFIHLPCKYGGLGLRSFAYEVAATRLRTYDHLRSTFPEFVSKAVLSELQAARNLISPNYDTAAKPKVNHVANLTEEWRRCVTQAVGLDLLTTHSPPSSLITFRYLAVSHAAWQKRVLARVGLLPTRSVLHRIDRQRPTECRHCKEAQETNAHALNSCRYSTQAMLHRHNKVRDRCFYAIRHSQRGNVLEIENEPRIRADNGCFLQPDAIVVNRPQRKVFVIDFAVVYETNANSLTTIYNAKVSKYTALTKACANRYDVEEADVSILPLVTGTRGCYDKQLETNLEKLGLHKRVAKHMATTSAEQASFVLNAFTGFAKNWRPNRSRKKVNFI